MYLQLFYLSIIFSFSYFYHLISICKSTKYFSNSQNNFLKDRKRPQFATLFIVFSIPSDSRGLFHFPQQFTYLHLHFREGDRFKSESRGQLLKGLYYAERRNRGV